MPDDRSGIRRARGITAALCAGVAVAAAFWLGRATAPRDAPPDVDLHTCAPGPWGTLRYAPTVIEIPPSRIRIPLRVRDHEEWFLRVGTPELLTDVLGACGMSAAQREALLDTARFEASTASAVLRPTDDFVLSLPPPVRLNLYQRLGREEANPAHMWPMRFDTRAPLGWFEESDHSCNYIADGMVFSKNGGSFAHPWILTMLDDLVAFYSVPDAVRLRFVRRRDLISAAAEDEYGDDSLGSE